MSVCSEALLDSPSGIQTMYGTSAETINSVVYNIL